MHFTDGMSQTALAKNLGISRIQVRRLVDRGIFKIDDAKRVSVAQAKKAYEKYLATVDDNKRSRSRKTAVSLIKEIKETEADGNFEATYKKWLSLIEADPVQVLNCAKAYLTAVQAKQEKLKLDELEHNLFSRDKINADAEKIGQIMRSRLLSLPARVATLCEGRTARDIEGIITDELNSALEELQKLYV